jgi:hypothetical protein
MALLLHFLNQESEVASFEWGLSGEAFDSSEDNLTSGIRRNNCNADVFN